MGCTGSANQRSGVRPDWWERAVVCNEILTRSEVNKITVHKKSYGLTLPYLYVSSLFVEYRACVLMWSAVLTSLLTIRNFYFTTHPNIDGSFLAVGSHDNFIYIYNVTDGGRRYTRFGKCTVSKACWDSILNDVKPFYGGLLFIGVVLKCTISHADLSLP